MNVFGFFLSLLIMALPVGVDLDVPQTEAVEITNVIQIDVTGFDSTYPLTDDNDSTYITASQTGKITLTADDETEIGGVYILFDSEPESFLVSSNDGEDEKYRVLWDGIHQYIDVKDGFGKTNRVSFEFEENTKISEIYVFGDGKAPSWVQDWDAPCSKADLLIVSTHADDEHLFFAGTIPYYASLGYNVQLVYITDHYDSHTRQHERLNGLWQAGVRNYPIFGHFPDAYSESLEGAVRNLERSGYTQQNVTNFLTFVIRTCKPLVIMGQDFEGEYGHGQHMLATDSLVRAVEDANNPDIGYVDELHDTPKTYIHLYGENKIRLNYDEPMEELDGKTPFEVSQSAFKCHKSQQYTWFTEWLCGTNSNPKTKATQIRSYSPLDFGLYRTTVGPDSGKNDLFENLEPYSSYDKYFDREPFVVKLMQMLFDD